MSSFHEGLYELGRVDQFATLDTPIHRVDPRAKVLATFVFLVCVVSFDKYTVIPMLPFAIFPIVMATEGRIPLGWLGNRLLAAAPFALLVGVFNPLLDRTVVAQIGSVEIIGGWISYFSIVVRFLLTTAAALALIATTSFNGVCMALERLGVPDVFATQLLLLYRYVFVLAEQALTMGRARDLRSFGKRGTGIKAFGQLLGTLLLRTYARAQRIYSAMLVRGFDGHIRTLQRLHFTTRDTVFVLGWSAVFIFFRFVNVPLVIGGLMTGSGL